MMNRLFPVLILSACSSKHDIDATALTIGAEFGDMVVWLDAEAGLIVERDGEELAWIPPERFQVRSADATYETMFGAFKIEEAQKRAGLRGRGSPT